MWSPLLNRVLFVWRYKLRRQIASTSSSFFLLSIGIGIGRTRPRLRGLWGLRLRVPMSTRGRQGMTIRLVRNYHLRDMITSWRSHIVSIAHHSLVPNTRSIHMVCFLLVKVPGEKLYLKVTSRTSPLDLLHHMAVNSSAGETTSDGDLIIGGPAMRSRRGSFSF